MELSINVALGSVPKDGGTFTFYRNIRPALENYGVTLYCVSLGKNQANLWEDSYADKNCVLLAEKTYSVKRQAKAFVDWCREYDIDIVIGINSEAILSAIPHLPSKIQVVSRCANAFDHGYRITLSGGKRIKAIVALTPRLQMDLVTKYKADPAITYLIPNGIDPFIYEKSSQEKRGLDDILRIGFLGRIEHNQKGVMHLPNLVQELDYLDVPFHLYIAGKGVDKPKLEKALDEWVAKGQVSFVGALGRDKVPKFLARIDAYIFPSHFEGCPNSLLESMMAGCVPLTWRIKGITDYIIKDGKTGFLHDLGDNKHMAQTIKKLHDDRKLLRKVSRASANDARLRFSPQKTAQAYVKVFRDAISLPITDVQPISWHKFRPDPNFRQKGDLFLSRYMKNKVKIIFAPFFRR